MLWTASGFRLVDYDGMFVAELRGLDASELGHRHYQHPARTARDFGPHIDHFAAWCLYCSILALTEHPEHWRRFGGDADRLLFGRSDFDAPGSSPLLAALRASRSPALRAVAARVVQFLGLPPSAVPPLSRATLAEAVANPPSLSSTPEWMMTTRPAARSAPLPDWMRSHLTIPPPPPPPAPHAPPPPAPCSCGRAVTRPNASRGSPCGYCHGQTARGNCRNQVRPGRKYCSSHV